MALLKTFLSLISVFKHFLKTQGTPRVWGWKESWINVAITPVPLTAMCSCGLHWPESGVWTGPLALAAIQ